MSNVNIPKTVRGRETLEKICKSAEQLFGENGYYKTSITDITKDANVAPGTFYIYFQDKISIFRYLIEDLSTALRREIAIATKDCSTRYDEEYIGFKTYFQFVLKHRGLYKIVMESQFVDNEIYKAYYENFSSKYIKAIKRAQDKGQTKPIDAESLAYSLIGIANFIGLRWVIWENKPVPDKTIEAVMEFVKSGAFEHTNEEP